MKKILVIALIVVLALGAFALTACGKEEKYEGEVHYANAWATPEKPQPDYGVKVRVIVKGGKIASVEILESAYVQTSSTWDGKADAEAAYEDYLLGFKGMKVADVLAIKVLPDGKKVDDIAKGQLAEGVDNYGNPKVVLFGGEDTYVIKGATQSSARLVMAIQAALNSKPIAE